MIDLLRTRLQQVSPANAVERKIFCRQSQQTGPSRPQYLNPKRMKLCTVIGARLQFIKAAVVSRALKEHRPDVQEILVHTGQ